MPIVHQIILGVMVAGFISFPVALFYGWVVTRGWEYDPDGVMPQVQWPEVERADEPVAEPEFRNAA